MAVDFKKNLSLIATVIIIFVIAIGGYYFINMGRGPYTASEFLSINYKWGVGDTLVNSYDSTTGNYQYLDNRDSLITTNVKLRANHIIFIHSKANELNLWTLPNVIANKNADLKSKNVLRYEITFVYEKESKNIIYLTDYDENASYRLAADQLQQMIKQTIDEIDERYGKP